ncbi:MAG: hypothetical protein AAF628_01940 [Planctomycetota bacterium]
MCDVERVERPGSYRDVVSRLERMTGGALGLDRVEDHVVRGEEGEEDSASVRIVHAGRPVQWDLRVNNDWLDVDVWSKYAALLAASNSPLRLFGDFADDGQVAFLAAFSPADQQRFRKRIGIKMQIVV